jgi:ADP-ribose pyrophosphatase YjhB (NUDIX family)
MFKKGIVSIIYLIWRTRFRLIYLLGGKVVGARALVIKNEEEILLVKHTYIQGWCTIGGEVDKNELPMDALKREIREEAGVIALKDPDLMAVYHNTFNKRDDYVFMYIVKDFDIVESNSPEIEESKWFPLHALPSDITPSTKRRIEEYHKKIPIIGKW